MITPCFCFCLCFGAYLRFIAKDIYNPKYSCKNFHIVNQGIFLKFAFNFNKISNLYFIRLSFYDSKIAFQQKKKNGLTFSVSPFSLSYKIRSAKNDFFYLNLNYIHMLYLVHLMSCLILVSIFLHK